jgi:hypothetical protein
MHNGLHDVVSDHVVLAPGSHKCQKRPTKMKRDLVRSKRGLHHVVLAPVTMGFNTRTRQDTNNTN